VIYVECLVIENPRLGRENSGAVKFLFDPAL